MEKNLIVILHKPQMAENVGMAARAMVNCGFTRLRLVQPLCGWPNKKADLASAENLDKMQIEILDSLQDAIGDLNLIFASSARDSRNLIKKNYSVDECVSECASCVVEGFKVGILFGPENNGLSNEEISFCDHIVSIESRIFSSYNLAQAVLILCYKLMDLNSRKSSINFQTGKTEVANKNDVMIFLNILEKMLIEKKYFRDEEKHALMSMTIRNFFMRSDITKQEINSLLGVFSAITN